VVKRAIGILIIIGWIACVEQIDFNAPEQVGVLVVDGQLSTIEGSNTIRLTRTDVLGKRVFPPEDGAIITVFDGEGRSESYLPMGEGRYQLMGETVEVAVGGSYHVKIQTSDGQKYQSIPETILPVPPVDSLHFELSIEEVLVDETRFLERGFFNLFVHTTMPLEEDRPLLKWDVENVFLLSEIVCSPLHAPKSCYVTRPINQNNVFVLDGATLESASSFSEQLVKQDIDFTFGLAASFYVSQKSLSEAAFRYWDNVDQIVNNVGSIFDAPPAAIPGNIICTSDPDQEVLGYFACVDEVRALQFVTRGDLPEDFIELPLCGLPGLPPPNFDRACCNCLQFENSSTLRPLYWP
jgi:hypothetical protein